MTSKNIPAPRGRRFFRRRVGEFAFILFTREFSIMFDGGLSVIRCLDVLAQQQTDRFFAQIIASVRALVSNGATLAEAMRAHPDCFDNFFVHLIEAGEASGRLSDVLTRLADHKEKIFGLKKKIKSALMYPVLLLSAALVLICIVLLFIIPVFMEVFADFGQDLPMITRVVITVSETAQLYGWMAIPALMLLIGGIYRFRKDPRGRLFMDKWLLRIPVAGQLLQKSAIARFAKTMETLIKSNVSLLAALDIATATAGNRLIETALVTAKKRVVGGGTFSEALEDSKVFPPMVYNMVALGESTGRLDLTLEKTAAFYTEQTDRTVENMTSMLEPCMMVLLGVMIGTLVVAIYLPIFKMAGVVM